VNIRNTATARLGPQGRLNRRRARLGALVLTAGILAAPAQALTLAEAFEAVRLNDPQYRAAERELEATRLGIPIARSSLLPQIALNLSTSDINGLRQFPNAFNQEVTVRVDYTAPSSSLSLRAPLLNFEGLGRLRQAEAQTAVAEQTFRARGLSLVDRLGTAYIQTLLVRTNVRVSEREVTAAEAQVQRAEQRQRMGEGTRTEEAQARSALEQARYRMIDARDQLATAMARLQRMTGQQLAWINELPEQFRPMPLPNGSLREWLDMAADLSPVLEARRHAVRVARAGVQRNRAGHLPRLDAVASVSRSRNESLNNLNQSSSLRSLGLQLSVPLYAGGGVDASVRQSESLQAQAEEELRGERETLDLEVQRLHQAVTHGVDRIDAAMRVVESTQIALTGVSRALDAGFATPVDVLDAQARLFSVQRDAAQARYEYLVARMRLMAQVGMPMHQVVSDLDQLLAVRAEVDTTNARAKP